MFFILFIILPISFIKLSFTVPSAFYNFYLFYYNLPFYFYIEKINCWSFFSHVKMGEKCFFCVCHVCNSPSDDFSEPFVWSFLWPKYSGWLLHETQSVLCTICYFQTSFDFVGWPGVTTYMHSIKFAVKFMQNNL
jgi:hypothetical protein